MFNFLSKLTFGKIANILKAELGFLLSRLLKRTIILGSPYSYAIEPTSRCNLHCPHCPTGLDTIKRDKGEITMKIYKDFVTQISGEATYLMLYLQGEPFINPNLFEMIQFASMKNIYTCTSTNGHFLDEKNAIQTVLSGLDRIIISLDGTTQEVYQKYRMGGSLQLVLTGIRNLVEAKRNLKSKTPVIILQFIVFKHNQHQISDFIKLGKKLKVDKKELKSAQIYDVNNSNDMLTDIDKYSRYRKDNKGYRLKRKLRNRCGRIFSTAAITHEGSLISCCYDKDGDFTMGNLNEKSFQELWKNRSFNTFRTKVLNNRKGIDICRNCNE